MNEQQRIYNVLQNMVGGMGVGGKKKSKKKEVEELFPARYKNPYVDDGSLAFKKMRMEMAEKLANYYWPDKDITVREIKSIPQSDIDSFIKQLRDSYQEEIDYRKKNDEEYLQAEKIVEKQEKKNKLKNNMDSLHTKDRDEVHQSLVKYKNPGVGQYKKLAPPVPADLLKNKTTERLAIGFGRQDEEMMEMMEGEGRKKKGRKINISEAERKRRSDRMKAMWRAKKL